MANIGDISKILHRIDDGTPDETARGVNELSALVCGRRLRWDLALSNDVPELLRLRLLRVLAMTSSIHQGEAWVALDRATDIVRKAGLNWIGVLPFNSRFELDSSFAPAPDASPEPQQAPEQEAADIRQSETKSIWPAAKSYGGLGGLIHSWRTDPIAVFCVIAPFILFFSLVQVVISAPMVLLAAFDGGNIARDVWGWPKAEDQGIDDGGTSDMRSADWPRGASR